MISTHVRMNKEGRGFIASNLRVWLCLRADPRKLKREIVQNPISVKMTTLENLPLYGIQLVWPNSTNFSTISTPVLVQL